MSAETDELSFGGRPATLRVLLEIDLHYERTIRVVERTWEPARDVSARPGSKTIGFVASDRGKQPRTIWLPRARVAEVAEVLDRWIVDEEERAGR